MRGGAILSFRLCATAQFSDAAPAFLSSYGPLDLIPDVLMIFGILDDIAVVSFGLRWAERRTPPEVLDDHRGRVNRLFDRWFGRPSEPAREPRWTRN